MPADEGLALHDAGCAAAALPGPMLEVGTYCGKSAVYLGAAAREARHGRVHRRPPPRLRGEPGRVGAPRHRRSSTPTTGRMDTLPSFRRTIERAGLGGRGRRRRRPLADRRARTGGHRSALLFIDGGHGEEPARDDYEGWTPHVMPGGLLVIHDVFPDPADGGRPPYEQIYLPALAQRGLRGDGRDPAASACSAGCDPGPTVCAFAALCRGQTCTRSRSLAV